MVVRCRRHPAATMLLFFFVVFVVCTLSVMVVAAEGESTPAPPPSAAVALLLQQQQQRTKEDEVQTLRLLYQSKAKTLQKLHDHLQHHRHTTTAAAATNTAVQSDAAQYSNITAKYNELGQRTNTIRTAAAVQGYNYNALVGGTKGGGLISRLRYVLHHEMKRRDRYRTNSTTSTTTSSKSSNTNYVTRDELTLLLLSASVVLDDHDNNNNNNNNNSLIANISAVDAMVTKVIDNYTQNEDIILHSRLQYISTKYPYEYNATINDALKTKKAMMKKNLTTKCLSIPKSIQLVTHELLDDGCCLGGGENNLVDYAQYGKVVYEMTSLPYVPSRRSSSSSSSNQHHHNNNDDEYDTMIENTFWQQQQQQQDNNADDSSWCGILLYHIRKLLLLQYDKVVIYNILYKYTTQYKLTSLRPYLPMDWERMLDYYFKSSSWSEHTLYSLLDNVIPDYIFHAWGLSYGSKTAHPTVVISSSSSSSSRSSSSSSSSNNSNNVVEIEGKEVAVGGERRRRRRNTSPMGQCYPLSMSTTTDPMDDLLTTFFATTHHHGDGEMNNADADADANKLGSSYGRPRYTIELPYATYIDAVTLEHRSFPIDHYHGDNVGGESAPRYVRVVGYPPCPTHDQNEKHEGDGGGDYSSSSNSIAHSCESSQYGFDITSPINLGLLEYQRITTVIDENDRYKTTTTTNTKKNEELLSSSLSEGGRHRSIQTFAVKGGLWKPRLLEEDVLSSFSIDKSIATQVENKENGEGAHGFEVDDDDDDDDNPEFVSPGQCTPPKDEDSLPSCGENINNISDRKESGESSSNRRKIVKAVSFVVEENWGNTDYTCLYRVRVQEMQLFGTHLPNRGL